MTQRTLARVLRASEVSRRKSDSGVVMRMSGGFRCMRLRSSGGVSPVRRNVVSSGSGAAAEAQRGVADPGEGRTEVAVDVVGQGFERATRRGPGISPRGSGTGSAEGDRGSRERLPESCPSRSGHGSGCGGRSRSLPNPRVGRRSARQTRPSNQALVAGLKRSSGFTRPGYAMIGTRDPWFSS